MSGERLGASGAGAFVVANRVGTGAFTVIGFALDALGAPGPVLLAWALGGTLTARGALSHGALGRFLPLSGGEYTVLARTVHPLAGFLAGWFSLVAGFAAPIAVAALALDAYAGAGPRAAVALQGGLALAAATLAATLPLRFIRHEKRALAASLGEPYARYRAEVRRWL